MYNSAQDILLASTHSSTTLHTTATAQQRLLATCPCLNVKLHLAAEPEQGVSLEGKELKLGLAGVSVEQKILCSLSISSDLTSVRCLNCNQDVYTFPPSSNSVNLESTSLAFLAGSILFSPSNGIVVPSQGVVTGQDIAALVNDPNYSKAFRLILAPTAPSSRSTSATAISSADQQLSSSPATRSPSSKHHEPLYRPHLERVRNILDKELEANLNAQQQRTEARIEAYKSQQLLALQKSLENTRREKERLWIKIQERVASPPPSTPGSADPGSSGGAHSLYPDGSLDVNGSQYSFDIPSTLPIRLTSASRVDGAHAAFLDRRKASVTDAAMSLQFREFDQRMASNSLRRQSLVPAFETTVDAVNETADLTLTNTAANAATAPLDEQPSLTTSNSGTSSPTTRSKKKVTISDAIKRVSIVEPEKNDYTDFEGNSDIDGEVDEDGVVFDLDEELGFDDEQQQTDLDEDEDEDSQQEDNEINREKDGHSTSNGNGIAISSSSRDSLPKAGMVVGSLRANYLRRQRGLQQQKRSLDDDELDFGEDMDGDDTDNDQSIIPSAAAFLGTSLPIQIQTRHSNPSAPTRISVLNLALPPGSTPAAAMLQRRLSRAYGADILSGADFQGSINNGAKPAAARSFTTSAFTGGPSSLVPPPTAGSLILDPLMLLEEQHDNDDREDRIRKHRQPFSSINHRRDVEKNLQELQDQDPAKTTVSSVTQQTDFEPPHLYSARTHVGSTPWEMPTRVTVKSGGMREGTHLDKQIAMEMAKELEKEQQEEAASEATLVNTEIHAHMPAHLRVVDKIDEAEEEEDDEDPRYNQNLHGEQHSEALPPCHPLSTVTVTAVAAEADAAISDGEERSES